MRVTFTLLAGLLLSGCVGTYVTGRDVQDSPYPKLHSVPDRPAKKDFSQAQQQLDDFEATHEKSLDENQRLRSVTRPTPDF